jgi:hypothetical protein
VRRAIRGEPGEVVDQVLDARDLGEQDVDGQGARRILLHELQPGLEAEQRLPHFMEHFRREHLG